MAVVFLDSSGLAKRYLNEVGTAWVISTTDPTSGDNCVVARITGVEVVSAVVRQHRQGALTDVELAAVLNELRDDLEHEYQIVEITPALIETAMALAETHAIRGYDAVQLAAAREVHAVCLATRTSLTLVSADTALNAAALAEGLTVEDPNSHP